MFILYQKRQFIYPNKVDAEFNLQLFKTLILNFAYNHSKHRKFTLYEKSQFIYPK